jgi:hypothetical protein
VISFTVFLYLVLLDMAQVSRNMYDTTIRNNKVHKLVRVGLFTLTYVIVQRTESGVCQNT